MTDSNNTPDASLLHQWSRHRDAEAFAELVRRYSGLTYSACRRILGNDSQAEEVAQDCFMALAEGSARRAACAGTWLHRVATNRALNRLRAENRRRAREDVYARSRPRSSETTWDDLQPHIDAAIDALPERLRTPVVLHYLESKTHLECANLLCLPRTTVTSRIGTGVNEIRKKLKRHGVVVSAALLMELLVSAKGNAAPATLVAALGKLAISGPPAAAALTSISALAAAKWAVVSVVLVALVVGVFVLQRTRYPADTSTVQTASMPQRVSSNEQAPAARSTHDGAAAANDALPPHVNNESKRDGSLADRPLRPDLARIHGRVTDGSGTALKEMQVDTAYKPGMGGGTSDLTDEKGRYIIDVPPAAEYYVAARRNTGGLRTDEVTVSNLEAGETYEVPLTAYGGAVSGIVVDTQGRLLPDAHVMAAPAKPWHSGLPTARADSTGRFSIEGLFPGDYTFQLQLTDGPWRNIENTITLAADEKSSNLRLVYPDASGLAIAGIVVDTDGNPVEHARIEVHHLPDHASQEWAWSGPDGAFLIEGLESGEFIVQSSHRNYTSEGVLKVTAGSEGHTVVMHPNGALQGSVVDAATQEPVVHFEVREAVPVSDSHPASVQWRWRDVENPSGSFSLENLHPGSQTITLRAEGYAQTEYTAVIPIADTLSGIAIPMSRERRYQGHVTNAEGQPVVGAQVFAGPLPNENERNDKLLARTDENGRFELRGIGPGVTTVSAWHHAYAPGMARLGNTDSDVVIVLDRGLELTGRVTHNGTPFEGASATIFFASADARMTEMFGSARTGADGRFTLSKVPREDVVLLIAIRTDDPNGGSLAYRYTLDLHGKDTYEQQTDFIDYTTEMDVSVTEQGVPHPGLFFAMTHEGVPEIEYTGHTSDSGHIAAAGLPPGEWTLRVYPPGAQGEEQAETISLVLSESNALQTEFRY